MEWQTIALPKPLIVDVEDFLKQYPHWISVQEFVRDATREKLDQIRIQNCEKKEA